jgi:type IV fimbrial biogenesis protein FimT
MRQRQRGFTLIELIIVIGILAIAMAIAIPNIINWLPNYRLKSAVRNLHSAAMKAKSEAVKRNENCALTFNQLIAGTNKAYVVFVDSDSDCEYDNGETVVYELESWSNSVTLDSSEGGGDGLTFLDNDNGNPTIVFRSNGVPTDNNGGIANGTAALLNTNGRKASVVIGSSGAVRIE